MPTFTLNALGSVSVNRDGDPNASITQPRQLALICYLVLARPRGRLSRDTLINLLWPESDAASGRQGLRNALYRLRTSLGEDAIRTIGEGFVEVPPGVAACDVFVFESAVAESRWEDAVNAWRGDFLNGFHVSDAPEFEHWLDGERSRLTNMVMDSAGAAISARQSAGDLTGAIRIAMRACGIRPDDERIFRRYLELLRDAGDHVAARRAYDTFSARLKAEFDAGPAPETRAVFESLEHAPVPPPVTRQAVVPADVTPEVTQSVRRRSGSRVLLLAAALAVVVLLLSWRALSKSAATLDASVVGVELDKRWRNDTALFARYLRGHSQIFAARNVPAARDTFLRLTQDAPLYAPGWAGLGFVTLRSGFSDLPPRLAIPRGAAAARRALDMDPTLSLALETLVSEAMWDRWNLSAAKALLDSALVRHPNDESLLNLLGTWYRWSGEFDKSLELKRSNAVSDPLSTVALFQVVPSLYFGHKCAEAVNAYRRLPDEVRNSYRPTVLYAAQQCAGMDDDLARGLRSEALSADSSLARMFVEPLKVAQRDSIIDLVMQRRIDRLLARRRERWVAPENIMVHYAFRRHVDSTFLWLDSMLVERSMMLYVVPFDPLMDFLRANPRFDALLQRLTWIPTLGASQRQVIDSLGLHARARRH